MEPTAAAYLLAERSAHIEEVLVETSQALSAMQAIKAERLFITLECHTRIEWLAPSLDIFRREYPSVQLDLRMGPLLIRCLH